MAKRLEPPVDDRPEDSPVAWFASMCLARERGDFQRAADAQRELERLGWSVCAKAPRRPHKATRREGSR